MNETKTGILHVCASILAEIHNRLAEISGSPQRIEMTMDDAGGLHGQRDTGEGKTK